MRRHGVRFQPSLSGALHLSPHQRLLHGRRQGAGQCLLTAAPRQLGVQVRYDAPVLRLELERRPLRRGRTWRRRAHCRQRACVVASGRLRVQPRMAARSLGPERARRMAADNFLIRGTRFNMGVLLKFMIEARRRHRSATPTQAHMVAIDARAPLYDGGICTRIDCVSLGIVVNREGRALLRRGRGLLAQALRDLGPPGGAAAGARSGIRSSTPRPSAASCRRCSRAPGPTRCPSWRQARPRCRPSVRHVATPTTPPAASAASTTRCSTIAAPKACARQDALGAAHRHRRPSTAMR